MAFRCISCAAKLRQNKELKKYWEKNQMTETTGDMIFARFPPFWFTAVIKTYICVSIRNIHKTRKPITVIYLLPNLGIEFDRMV